MSWRVVSLGGSVIAPRSGEINLSFIDQCAHLLARRYADYGQKCAIVTGGGNVARRYQHALREVVAPHTEQEELFQALDTIGIAATRVHAAFVAAVMARSLRAHLLRQPAASRDDIPSDAECVVSGGWRPGASTDYVAMRLAFCLGARQVVNISDTAYVYTADPRRDPAAKPCHSLTWERYFQIVGTKWQPGVHVPIDPHAARLAQQENISARLVAPSVDQLERALEETPHEGSIITG